MSALPERGILTSIGGQQHATAPRNDNSTIINGSPSRPTNLPTPTQNDALEAILSSAAVTSLDGIFLEQPSSSSSSLSFSNSSPSFESTVVASNSQALLNFSLSGAEAPAATSAGEGLIDAPEGSQEPEADEQESQGALPLSTSEGLTEETGVSAGLVLATPTEEEAVVSPTQGIEDAATQVTEDPTPVGEGGKLRNGDFDGTGLRDSPRETSRLEVDDQSDDENTAPAGIDGTPGTMTTIGLEDGAATTMSTGSKTSGDDSGLSNELSNSGAAGSDGSRKTGVIAGSVVGAVAAVALIAFLLWFRRKRSQRDKYTIRSPVFKPPKSSRTEKTWEFDTASLGPTPRSARFAEAVRYKLNATGNMFKPTASPGRNRGVNIERGDSPFMDSASSPADVNGGAGIRAGARGAAGRISPDRRASDGSAHWLSGTLGLVPNDPRPRRNNPFSDAHAVQQNPQPRSNPFDDAHQAVAPMATLPQTTYDPGAVQRPRGLTTASILRHHPSSASRANVRSDQFDLEIGPHPGTLVRPDSFTSRVSSLRDWTELGPCYGSATPGRADQRRPGGVGEAL